ncbi:class I SAM-dependent methyltransferase [Xanthobacteraceae bacterium A53D]
MEHPDEAPRWLWLAQHVPGWLEPAEALLLHDLAARQHRLGRCVELGSYQGRSALALASALPAGESLLCVDTFAGSAEHQPGQAYFNPATLTADGAVSTLSAFHRHVRAAGLTERVETWVMPTTTAASRFSGSVALLFVDADHSYAAIVADVEAWRPHLAPDAVLVLHDVGDWEGPTRHAADLLAAGFSRLAQCGTALALTMPQGG